MDKENVENNVEQPLEDGKEENAENVKEGASEDVKEDASEGKVAEEPQNNDNSDVDGGQEKVENVDETVAMIKEEFNTLKSQLNTEIENLRDVISKMTLSSGVAIHDESVNVNNDGYESNYEAKRIDDLDLN